MPESRVLAELVPAGRVAETLGAGIEEPGVDRGHVPGVDLAAQTEGHGAGAPPAPRWLALGDRPGVVVLPPGCDLAQQVVRVVARRDTQHADHLRGPLSREQ